MTSPMNKKPFHCSDCGKEFSKEKKLLSHFKVHTTGKIYKCEVCKATFSLKALYKKHIRTHFEKGSCSCPKCGKVFVRHSWLKRHLNSQCDEKNQNNNKFACRECGKIYDSLTGVRSHLLKGKHAAPPAFTCYLCKWVCSSSKSLFIHVLQHNSIDIIVVGIDQEQRLEYFSTSKIRARVDVFKLRPPASSEAMRSSAEEEANPHSIIEIDVDEDLPQTENPQSQNTMEIAKVSPHGNLIPSTTANNALQEEDLGQYQSIISEAFSKELLNATMLPKDNNAQSPDNNSKIVEDAGSATTTEPLRALLSQTEEFPDENGNQNQTAFTAESSARASQSPHDDSLQDGDMVPKKMPKLVSLYPEEEPILPDNTCVPGNSNLAMQSDVTLSHRLLCNGLSADPVANRHNEILMPYPAPLVNTMFLPPLFLVHNSLPMNHQVRPQNTFQAGEPLVDNQHMTDKTSAPTIMDELKSMTSDLSILKKKRKRQTRFGKKYAEIIKQMQQGASSTDMLARKPRVNKNQLAAKDVTKTNDNDSVPLSSSLSTADQPSCSQKSGVTLPHDSELRGQENSYIPIDHKASCAADWFMIEDKDQCNGHESQNKNLCRNDFWETLIGSDDNDKKVTQSSTAGFKSQSTLHGRVQRGGGKCSQFPNDRDESKNKNANNKSTSDKSHQQSPKEGIAVEDYIRKFMWL